MCLESGIGSYSVLRHRTLLRKNWFLFRSLDDFAIYWDRSRSIATTAAMFFAKCCNFILSQTKHLWDLISSREIISTEEHWLCATMSMRIVHRCLASQFKAKIHRSLRGEKTLTTIHLPPVFGCPVAVQSSVFALKPVFFILLFCSP